MDFGRLERASVRKAWPHEALDFTPPVTPQEWTPLCPLFRLEHG